MPRLRKNAGRLLVLVIVVTAVAVIFAFYIGLQMQAEAFPRYGKGGVGIIAGGTYVLTKDPINTILRDSNVTWKGTAATESQTTFVSPVLVSFSPDAIRFFDFSTLRGGNYLRATPLASNKALQRTPTASLSLGR